MSNKYKEIIPYAAGAGYIPGLDGIRALSILVVFIGHMGFGNILPGGLGVTIFFFVSGFLITRLLVGEQNARAGEIDLKSFYIRRFLRLMPALYVFIFVVSVLATPFGGKPLFIHILMACLYLVNYYDVLQPFTHAPIRIVPWGHLWSLAVEEHFYLLFPAALAIFGKTHKQRLNLLIIAMIISAIWRYLAIVAFNLGDEYTYNATDCRLESIAWGCLLAVLMDGMPKENAKLSKIIGLPYFVIGLALLGFTLFYRDETFRSTWRYSVQGFAIFILILNLYSLPILKFAIDILETKPMRFIGRLSYSLYLWHWPVVWIFSNLSGVEAGSQRMPPTMMAGAIVISLILACASYYGIERPFFALRKKFGGHPVEAIRN